MTTRWNLKFLIPALFLFSSELSLAQDSLNLERREQVTAFAVDAKGNIFIAYEANTLFKLNAEGKEITNVNTKVYGTITFIDCSNPFELYVYHQQQNIVVFYDNMLNERGALKLNELGFNSVTVICRSYDNGLWIFDYSDNQLKKINKEGKVQSSSGSLSLFVQQDLAPYKMIDYNNHIYLADSSLGLLVFDIFGTYLKTISLEENKDFTVGDSSILVMKDHSWMDYNMISFEQTETLLSFEPAFIASNQTAIYILANHIIYRFPKS